MCYQNGNLLWQQTTTGASGGLGTDFLEHEAPTHYYWLPTEQGDILVGFDQGINSYAVYTDHLGTPRLVTKIENPQNPRAETDTSNDLEPAPYGEPQGISPLAIPVWQWSYSPFGADLANGYEAQPTSIKDNFKPTLWAWVGLPETGGADPNQVAQETWRIQANLTTAPTLNLRYPGQYHDFETGLVQNWWRTYEPRIGRYVSTDPIGLEGGWNRFAYVEGDGINLSDRMGLQSFGPASPRYIAEVVFGKATNWLTSRTPDYVQISVTAPVYGVGFTMDRYGNFYFGVNTGNTMPSPSAQICFGRLNRDTEPKVPSADELKDFITGAGGQASLGQYGVGGGWAFSGGKTATQITFGTPAWPGQGAAGYTWELKK